MKKIICRIIGHSWLFNFYSYPSKAICKRCYTKSKFNPRDLEWEPVDNFENEKRTDKQLVKSWTTKK